MKANLFDVLNRMNTEHVGSVHAYFSDNVKHASVGKKGWGDVTVAITTGDAQEILNYFVGATDETKRVLLFVVDVKTMLEVKQQVEATPEPSVNAVAKDGEK